MSEFFMHSFNTLSHGLIGYVVPFLFVLTIVVFFHELGHFLVARWAGVKVLTFSLGFGPELAGFNDRHGTRWKISAIPLGGYVKFFGDDIRGLHALVRNARRDERSGACGQFPPQEGRSAGGHRRRRPDREFHPGDRYLHLPVHLLRQAEHDGAGRQGRGGERRSRRRFPGRRYRHDDRWQQDRQLLRHAAHRQHSRRRYAELHDQARRRHAAIAGDARASGRQGSVRQQPSAGHFGHHPRDRAR